MVEDPLTQLNTIGQKALALPTDILNVGARRVTEDVGMLSTRIQDIGSTLTPPTGLALPNLPLPGMPAAGSETAATAAAGATRSEKVQGVRKTRQTSYLKV